MSVLFILDRALPSAKIKGAMKQVFKTSILNVYPNANARPGQSEKEYLADCENAQELADVLVSKQIA